MVPRCSRCCPVARGVRSATSAAAPSFVEEDPRGDRLPVCVAGGAARRDGRAGEIASARAIPLSLSPSQRYQNPSDLARVDPRSRPGSQPAKTRARATSNKRAPTLARSLARFTTATSCAFCGGRRRSRSRSPRWTGERTPRRASTGAPASAGTA